MIMANDQHWIEKAVKNGKGGLHKSLGLPMAAKIPAKMIAKAAKSGSPKLAKQANLAKTLKRLKGAI